MKNKKKERKLAGLLLCCLSVVLLLVGCASATTDTESGVQEDSAGKTPAENASAVTQETAFTPELFDRLYEQAYGEKPVWGTEGLHLKDVQEQSVLSLLKELYESKSEPVADGLFRCRANITLWSDAPDPSEFATLQAEKIASYKQALEQALGFDLLADASRNAELKGASVYGSAILRAYLTENEMALLTAMDWDTELTVSDEPMTWESFVSNISACVFRDGSFKLQHYSDM